MSKIKAKELPFKETDLLKLFADIEAGTVKIRPAIIVDPAYYGTMFYYTPSGWKIAIFIDYGYWQYIEAISGNGQTINREQIKQFYPQIARYKPSRQIVQKIYKVDNVR